MVVSSISILFLPALLALYYLPYRLGLRLVNAVLPFGCVFAFPVAPVIVGFKSTCNAATVPCERHPSPRGLLNRLKPGREGGGLAR